MTDDPLSAAIDDLDRELFSRIGGELSDKGYSINPGALPFDLGNALSRHLGGLSEAQFNRAGVGRNSGQHLNDTVRTDSISWILRDSAVECAWLDWAARLQMSLNRQLFLGLNSFESHFARYVSGDFYARHSDAFKGESNRVLSLVVHLNPDWAQGDGGELVLFTGAGGRERITVNPCHGTVSIFLSEDFPHEVLIAKRDRYSIAGWFRVNSSLIN